MFFLLLLKGKLPFMNKDCGSGFGLSVIHSQTFVILSSELDLAVRQ